MRDSQVSFSCFCRTSSILVCFSSLEFLSDMSTTFSKMSFLTSLVGSKFWRPFGFWDFYATRKRSTSKPFQRCCIIPEVIHRVVKMVTSCLFNNGKMMTTWADSEYNLSEQPIASPVKLSPQKIKFLGISISDEKLPNISWYVGSKITLHNSLCRTHIYNDIEVLSIYVTFIDSLYGK